MRQLIISILLIFTGSIYADDTVSVATSDSININANKTENDSLRLINLKYKNRLEKYHKFWSALTPEFARLQFAGSVGVISGGMGWNYGKNDKLETDFMFGYLPKYSTSDHKITFTLRESYIPWNISATKQINIQPFSCGLFLNTIFNDKFWVKEPSRYPGGYYSFSSKIRIHFFVGQRYQIQIPEKYVFFNNRIAVCWELSTCDLYIVSAVTNKYIKWNDILSLSLGLKLSI